MLAVALGASIGAVQGVLRHRVREWTDHLLRMAMAARHAAAHVFGSLACVSGGFGLARVILRA
jgi:hypothetical protein